MERFYKGKIESIDEGKIGKGHDFSMNLSVQRKIDRILGSFICGILSLFSNRGKIKPTAIRTSKILVILLSEMGSLVLARPMFDNIKKIYPHTSSNMSPPGRRERTPLAR